jgi:hypothetical protein
MGKEGKEVGRSGRASKRRHLSDVVWWCAPPACCTLLLAHCQTSSTALATASTANRQHCQLCSGPT